MSKRKLYWLQNIVRWALSILLLFGVYSETGKWTTIVVALIFLGTELATLALRRAEAAYTGAMNRTDKLIELLTTMTEVRSGLVVNSIRPEHFSPQVQDYVVQVVGKAIKNREGTFRGR